MVQLCLSERYVIVCGEVTEPIGRDVVGFHG
jgi:hypothetical protein